MRLTTPARPRLRCLLPRTTPPWLNSNLPTPVGTPNPTPRRGRRVCPGYSLVVRPPVSCSPVEAGGRTQTQTPWPSESRLAASRIPRTGGTDSAPVAVRPTVAFTSRRTCACRSSRGGPLSPGGQHLRRAYPGCPLRGVEDPGSGDGQGPVPSDWMLLADSSLAAFLRTLADDPSRHGGRVHRTGGASAFGRLSPRSGSSTLIGRSWRSWACSVPNLRSATFTRRCPLTPTSRPPSATARTRS